MYDLKCRTAHLWLQAPDDLSTLDARHLQRHLTECAQCEEYRRTQVRMDRLIQTGLSVATDSTSVHSLVRTRLIEKQQSPAGRGSFSRRVLTPLAALHRKPAWRPLGLVASFATVAALVAVFGPHLTTRDRQVPTAGAAWHAVRPSIGYPLTVDTNRPNHLLAGASGGVYESWNSGDTWRQLAALPPQYPVVRDVAIDATQPNRYLVAAKHSVLISTDAGKHWSVAINGVQGAMNIFLSQDVRRPNIFYLGPGVLWRSLDHGQTWARDGTSTIFAPYGIQALSILPNGTLYTGIWGGGVAVSNDGGRSWQRRAQGLDTHVLSVAARPDGKIWAATSHGLYRSTDSGLHWHRSSPSGHFFATSVFDGGKYLLAGGNGGLYRSDDGGTHWHLANTGLPLSPYIFGFVGDPRAPQRVYASLDSDGIYRSDDSGLHWKAISSGLPLTNAEGATHYVLFHRHGALWITDGNGADPGNLTSERNVRVAAMSTDGGAVAYIAGTRSAWVARLLCSGGCAAHSITTGSGPLPNRIAWAPTGTLLALIQPHSVIVTAASGHSAIWSPQPQEVFVAWSPDGHDLLFWDSNLHTIRSRAWATGVLNSEGHVPYSAVPVPAPDGKSVAFASRGSLYVGTWLHGVHVASHVASSCRLVEWSDDSSRLLLTCGGTVQERTVQGRLVARGTLRARVFWAPGSNTDLLFFKHHSLWRWTPPANVREIASNAQPIGAHGTGQTSSHKTVSP
ncbi:MAG: hypothetical protein NVSMB52_07030 [Chloroflexota bacterium]